MCARGVGFPKNKLIVLEVLRSASLHGDGTESHIFFNARIKETKTATERQRLNFYKKKGHFCSTSNTDLDTIFAALKKELI